MKKISWNSPPPRPLIADVPEGRGAMEADSDLSKPPLPKDGRREAEPRRARAGPRGQAVRQRLNRGRPAAPAAHRIAGRQAGRRAGHLDRRVGALVLDGPCKTGGKLYTHDIDPGRIAVALRKLQEVRRRGHRHHHRGRRHQTAPRNKHPIDILFIDAEKEGYDAYLKEPATCPPGGLIIAHNMKRPAPNLRDVEAITASPTAGGRRHGWFPSSDPGPGGLEVGRG